MRILIEIPAWIGDAVMATPTIENIINHYDGSEISIIGSTKAIELFEYHPNIIRVIAFNKQYLSMLKTTRRIGQFDVYFSFRNSIRSKLFKYFISSKKKHQFDSDSSFKQHQVEKYNNFLNKALHTNFLAGNLNSILVQLSKVDPQNIKTISLIMIIIGACLIYFTFNSYIEFL